MKYVGSKLRHAKDILPIILSDRIDDQYYVEPFCGGCNTLSRVSGSRIGNDINHYLIAMWEAVVYDNWIPPSNISVEEYTDIRLNKEKYNPALVGFVGVGSSYSGKWFGGYARGNGRNYADETKRNILKQAEYLEGVRFESEEYYNLDIPTDSIVYADPPYEGTTSGYSSRKFDHEKFWNWIRDLVLDGNRVFVSEYKAPDDFVCVWSKVVNNTLEKETDSKQGIECLFVHESQVR